MNCEIKKVANEFKVIGLFKKACRMCKRKLTSKKSKQIGMGPTCARKFGGMLEREYLEKQG